MLLKITEYERILRKQDYKENCKTWGREGAGSNNCLEILKTREKGYEESRNVLEHTRLLQNL